MEKGQRKDWSIPPKTMDLVGDIDTSGAEKVIRKIANEAMHILLRDIFSGNANCGASVGASWKSGQLVVDCYTHIGDHGWYIKETLRNVLLEHAEDSGSYAETIQVLERIIGELRRKESAQ